MQEFFRAAANEYGKNKEAYAMRLKTQRQGRILKAALFGELDQHSAEQVRDELDELLREENITRLEFDLKGVSFMDSAGIGVILGRYKKLAARGGSMDVRNAEGSVEKVLRMSGVYTLVTERSTK